MSERKFKLTDAQVAKAVLPAGMSDFTIWDTEVTGFGLRIRKTTKTYFVMYRPAGAGRSENPKRFKIGTPQTLESAAEARRLARSVLGRVAEGKDPAADRKELKRRAKAKVEGLLLEYDKFNEERGYVDRAGTLSTLQRNLKHLFNRDIATISGSEYVAIRKRLTDDGLKGAADNFWSRCRAFLSWCVNDQVLQLNPIISHKATKRTRKAKIEDEEDEVGVVIPGDKLMDIWEACDMATAFGRYIRFLILSGCRRTEGSKAARSMRSLDQKRRPLLILPKYITKSGRDHNLPLTKQMADLLKGCEIDARSDLYFPSHVTGRPMQGWASMLTKLKKKSGVDFALHDLRKTFRTGLAALGVNSDIAGICLNHSRKGLEKVYNHHDAPDEMRNAFTLWESHIEKLIKRRQPMFRRFPGPVFIGPRKPKTQEEFDLEERARQEDEAAKWAYFDELERLGIPDGPPPLEPRHDYEDDGQY